MQQAPSQIPIDLSETAFQTMLIEYAILLGWHVVHFRPARRGTQGKFVTALEGMKGSPDLIMARNGRVLLVELKTSTGKLSPEQSGWLLHLQDHGRVWTPADWNSGTIYQELRRAA